jgi:hypothetical protein
MTSLPHGSERCHCVSQLAALQHGLQYYHASPHIFKQCYRVSQLAALQREIALYSELHHTERYALLEHRVVAVLALSVAVVAYKHADALAGALGALWPGS